MSLLMKALQKAEKNREQYEERPRQDAQSQLSLEDLERELEAEPVPDAEPDLYEESGIEAHRPQIRAEPLTPPSPRVEPGIGSEPAQETARAVLQATQPKESWGDRLMLHRWGILGTLVGLAVVGYGGYFYVAINHPVLLVARPRSQPQPAALPPATPVLPVPPAPEAVALPEAPAAAPEPPPPAVPVAVPKAAPAAPATPPPRPADGVAVKSGGAPAEVPRLLMEAYAALAQDRSKEASEKYSAYLQTDPRNIDALLGLAAVAMRLGEPETAAGYFGRVLELDPRNSAAQAGLLGSSGKVDANAAESRLKQLIAREPSAFLYFALGNLYADQFRWPQAQQAYFQAYRLAPDNPAYAYNLAVGLEHLSQPRLALTYYRRALELAGRHNVHGFDPALAQERVAKLGAAEE